MATTTITITAASPLELEAKKKALSDIAGLPAADRNRLHQIARNPKALAKLAGSWTMLQAMFR